MTAFDGIIALAASIRTGEISPVEAVDACLAQIERLDPLLNAFINVRAEAARTEARAAERQLSASRDDLPSLLGIPLAVKDNIEVAGIATTVGSAARTEQIARADAEVVRRLRAAGAVLVGTLNLHEWAFGATGLNTAFGPARNPWDTTRTPGGSSSGAGAAVAAGLLPGALGTDSGGSVRMPASLCGITGLRPTIGRVSTRGVIPLTWTFDSVGPLARDAQDAGVLLAAIAGFDAEDARSCDVALPRVEGGGIDGLRVGLLRGWFADSTNPAIVDAVDRAAAVFEEAGAVVQEVVLEGAGGVRDRMNDIIQADAAAAHAERMQHAPETIATEVRVRLELGAALSAPQYALATEERYRFRRRLKLLFSRVDVLLCATTPTTAPKLDECDDPEVGRTLTRLAYPFSFGGTPTLSIPCGVVEGLPVGMQLVAPDFHEPRLLRVAREYQRETDWHLLRPPTSALEPKTPER